MAEGTKLRAATRADRDRLVEFHRALYLDHRKTVLSEALAELAAYHDMDRVLEEDIDAILKSPGSIAIVAERDGEVVGYVTGHVEQDRRRVLPRRGLVEDWFVAPELRGEGLGRALLEELLQTFRGRGCQVAESATWPNNDGARAAHERLGFREYEVRYRRRLEED